MWPSTPDQGDQNDEYDCRYGSNDQPDSMRSPYRVWFTKPGRKLSVSCVAQSTGRKSSIMMPYRGCASRSNAQYDRSNCGAYAHRSGQEESGVC